MTTPDPNYDWLSELPMPAGDPFLRMGTRGLDEGDWLLIDHVTADELALRSELLLAHPDHAQLLEGHDEHLAELIEHVEAFRHAPLVVGPHVEGVRPELSDLAVTIQEDTLLMVRNDEHWYLAGGVLMFPDQWTLPNKIGKSMAGIHEPTDGYDELLEAKADQFLDRLSPGRLVKRRNWFVHDDPTHFLSAHVDQREITNPSEVEGLWVRSERQTLRRLERTNTIVFTVKTQFAPLVEVKSRPEVAAGLVTFLEQASDRSLDNKNVAGRAGAVVAYLTQ